MKGAGRLSRVTVLSDSASYAFAWHEGERQARRRCGCMHGPVPFGWRCESRQRKGWPRLR